ncbi:hypothetical protein E4U53_000135 [Claviceps sorghi]|nr:hypothetical protein E4U53_000135 [Claviceps sorghi]
MVEKAGHKKRVVVARNELLNEGRPKAHEPDLVDDGPDLDAAGHVDGERPATPRRDNGVPDEDDLYGATPRNTRSERQTGHVSAEEDDLDALIAEVESRDRPMPGMTMQPVLHARPIDAEGEDDLDALMAEVESREGEIELRKPAAREHSGKNGDDFAEEEEAMQEMDGLW